MLPLIVVPVAFWREPTWRRRALLIVVTGLTIVVVALPFALLNPELFGLSWTINLKRGPWETVWALLEGYTSYGLAGGGNRFDPAEAGANQPPGHLPWPLISLGFALLYLWLVAPRLIPERKPPMNRNVSRVYTAQIRLDKDSSVVGKTLAEAITRAGEGINVETIQRGQGVFINPLPDVRLRGGDRLTTSDTQANLREYARLLRGTLFSDDQEVDASHPLSPEGLQIAEIAITPASQLNGVRIGNAQLFSRYSLRLLAFNRYEGMEERESPGLDEVRLRAGDVLLIQSSPENLVEL